MSASTVGAVNFRMFNREYQYNQNAIAELLHFPYGEGSVCETPLDPKQAHEFFRFWEQMTCILTDSF